MLAIIGLISAAFGVSLASALVPLISVEVFVVGVVLHGPGLPWWLLAVVVAVGQLGGKLLHYYAARGVVRLPRFLRHRKADAPKGRWRAWLDRFRDNCQERPVWAGGVLLFSALTSLPPFFATAVVAGWARIPLPKFLVAVFVGRFVRFAVLAIAPAALVAWL